MKIGACFVLGTVTGLIGCSSIPTAGPTTSQIIDQVAEAKPQRFDLVVLDDRAIAAQAARPAESLRARFAKFGKPPPPTIGVGDVVSVSIWETTGGAALAPAATEAAPAGAAGASLRSVALPDQVVGRDGAISVPYAGRVSAAGRTPAAVEQTIGERLAERAIEPQAIVTVAKSVANTAIVSGETVTGARVPLSPGGDRLLDVIATAGGAKSPLYETSVRLSRGGVTVTMPMERLVSDPAEDIYAWPGDAITLVRAPKTFSAFGATGYNTQLPFAAEQVNLAQAIAKAGGLLDLRADPAGVFLFRFEPPRVVRALGVAPAASAPDGSAPILYHLDLRDAVGYFLAEKFPVEDHDIIYVANAPITELQKFFNLVNTITGPVIGGVVVSRSVSQ
jgi:polysaccharide export outer membrane protein